MRLSRNMVKDRVFYSRYNMTSSSLDFACRRTVRTIILMVKQNQSLVSFHLCLLFEAFLAS